MKPPENPITPAGLRALKARYDHLLGEDDNPAAPVRAATRERENRRTLLRNAL